MDDLISRQAVLDKAINIPIAKIVTEDKIIYRRVVFVDEIEQMPSAEKTGHWIEEDMFDGDVAYRCSECNELFWIEDGTPKDNGYDFCPKCGAMMIEPQERSEDAT